MEISCTFAYWFIARISKWWLWYKNDADSFRGFEIQKGKGLKYGLLAKWVDPLKYLNVYDGQTTSTNGTKDLIPHTKKVTAKDGLNVRNKPSVKGGIVYTAKYNSQVETHGVKNGWNIVDNVLGYYCSNKYIK